MDAEKIRSEAKGLPPTDPSQRKALDQLESYDVLGDFDDVTKERKAEKALQGRGEGSAYSGHQEDKELSSYTNILTFPPPPAKSQSGKHPNPQAKVGRPRQELRAYNNILRFPSQKNGEAALNHSKAIGSVSKEKKAMAKAVATKGQTSMLFGLLPSTLLDPSIPFAKEWNTVWQESKHLRAQTPAGEEAVIHQADGELKEIRAAVVKVGGGPFLIG